MIVNEVSGSGGDDAVEDIPTLVDNLEYIMKRIFNKTEVKEVSFNIIKKSKSLFHFPQKKTTI